jgi:predicted DNA-binding transcriptional regulator AlpA
MENKLLNTLAVSELFGVSIYHVEQLRKSGALPHVKLGKNRLVRYRSEDIQVFLDSLAKEPQSRGVRSLRKLGEQGK